MKFIYFSSLSFTHNALLKISMLDDTINTSMAIRNATTSSNPNLDTQTLIQSLIEENWEELFVAGPIMVNCISNLMISASKKDFPLKSSSLNHVYQYIIYPNSFRATLAQIHSEMYSVFLRGHTNMDSIQLSMKQIPQYFKTILKVLKSASPNLIQRMVTTPLDNIEKMAKDSVALTNIMIKKYENLTLLLQETIEVATRSCGVNSTFLTNINILVNITTQVNKLQQQWSQITRYSNQIIIRVETIRETAFYELIDTIKNVTSMNSELTAADREVFFLKMRDTMIEIEQDAYLLYITTKTYYDVSATYVALQLQNASRLLVLQTDTERQTTMTQLDQNMLFALAEISQMVSERKQQCQQRNQEIQEEYKQFIQQMMFDELTAGIGK
ncbi:unnamed protein product [Adineta ricciae]|uniref:Uncharacterized protein n=1 Tax=Adineta ricciae TaxID=249248 RepID=A0A815LEA3_ADIRI|nr:unnamed protein product [Adineta ricciae]